MLTPTLPAPGPAGGNTPAELRPIQALEQDWIIAQVAYLNKAVWQSTGVSGTDEAETPTILKQLPWTPEGVEKSVKTFHRSQS